MGRAKRAGDARWLPMLPSWMGDLSQAVAVAGMCTPGVSVCRVPDVIRASLSAGDSSERESQVSRESGVVPRIR